MSVQRQMQTLISRVVHSDHINCFIKGEVLGFRVLLKSLQPRYTRTSQRWIILLWLHSRNCNTLDILLSIQQYTYLMFKKFVFKGFVARIVPRLFEQNAIFLKQWTH